MAPMDNDEQTSVRLVTRGDDAGLAPSVNEAVRDCYDDGLLRNVSVMATGPALADAAERLAGVDGLCVGVHLTLTAEWDHPEWGPVLPRDEVPSLVDETGSLPLLAEQFVERDPAPTEVRRELEAQLAAVRAVGFDPVYLDTHMALERQFDWFADELAALCEREGLIDGTTVPLLPGAAGPGTDPEWLLEHLSGVDEGTYLVVGHPAYEAADTRAIVGLGLDPGEEAANRVSQRRLFTDDRVLEYCEANGVEAVRYDGR